MALPQTTTSATKQDPAFPGPQKFDILPALHELLSRIDHTPATNEANIPVPGLTDPAESNNSSNDIGALYTDQVPLEPKDLPNETLQIKWKIRSALKALEKLPDMDRTVEEQRAEIEMLEGRIERQRAMVEKLGVLAEDLKGRV